MRDGQRPTVRRPPILGPAFLPDRRVLIGGLAGLAFAAPVRGQAPGRKPLRVVTTFTILQDMAQNVAGTAALVDSLTKPGAEIHDYQPTPQDVVRAQSADLVLWNGLNLERWFERFFANIENVASATVSDGVSPMPIKEGPYASLPNPHAWMSVSAALIYIENIRAALAKADPANAESYARNAAAYT
ncbi:MAG: metal ABC transporter solute-binding protein, Zn/Mn family, partial [Beijerinckiaceae bacterium]